MQEAASKRRSSRIPVIRSIKPNLKRKATAPLTTNYSERPALRNLTNQSNNIKNNTSEKESGEKKIPNYLKPTFSTQQKCSQKKAEAKRPQPPPIKKGPRASMMPRAETRLKPMKEATVNSASQNYFGFEEESENKKPETGDPGKEVSESQSKPEAEVASPLRIEIVPVRKSIPSTPKPPVNHVLSVLKSSLSSPLTKTPRTTETKLPQFFKTITPQRANETAGESAQIVDEPNISFDQPARRSYSRPRPVTNFSEFDEPDSEEEKENDQKKENVIEKEEPKGKQKKQKKAKKNAKDEQFEELAAAINSQFNQVENFQLVVE